MAFPSEQKLEQFLQPLVAEKGLDVEHIKTTKAGKKSQVAIRLDGDKRPSSDVLEEMSRIIGDAFDAAEESGELNFGAGYTLEISTPGVDLPLTEPRHFRRNRGRLLKQGRIGALSDDEKEVIVVTSTKDIAKVEVQRLENLAGSVVEIEFAPAPVVEQDIVELSFEAAKELVS
ncbi:ribosome maturation factor RimP [Corynebacterium sp. L4756]|uniref:ribosome maturation factor RimP n=1 Tax=unclassified Corynebacterium TaxID=2624378 RepID=UPI00374D7B04